MVTAISDHSFSGGIQNSQTNNLQSITQDQRKVIEDTLAKYDPQNLTQAEASSIVEMFNDSSIQPGRELAEAMTEFGLMPGHTRNAQLACPALSPSWGKPHFKVRQDWSPALLKHC